MSDSGSDENIGNSDLSDEGIGAFNSEDESSDDLEEIIEEIGVRPKNSEYFEETVPQYTDQIFLEHFRVTRDIANSIAEQFELSIHFRHQAGAYGKLSSQKIIYIYLWFVGHQTASFRDVADRFDITLSSLHRIIIKVTYFLSNLSPQIIKWPLPEEQLTIERSFRMDGFPGVIGVIDGSHIKIDKPSNDPESYINRKGFYSIQLQVVCDHRLQIRDIFVGYPGSVHDSRVFRASPLFATLEEKCGDLYILGDSGYPLLPHVMTPFRDHGQLTRAQSNYNVKLAKNRYRVEHCFGLLKQKFRQLFHIKLRKMPDIVHMIRACCVLHNLALNNDFHLDVNLGENNVQNILEIDDNDEDNRNGTEVRNRVVNMLARQ